MIRLILYIAIGILLLFAYRFYKLLSNYKTGSRPNINDLKDRAEYLKNKYKNAEEAQFKDITPSEDEDEPEKK